MIRWLVLGTLLVGLGGCTGGSETPKLSEGTRRTGSSQPRQPKPETGAPLADDDLKPLTLGPSSDSPTEEPGEDGVVAARQNSVVEALHPFNTLLGDWEGKTRKQFEGFAKVDTVTWLWDHKTDRSQPSVTFTSDRSPYFRQAWLTFLPDKQRFRLTLITPEKDRRILEGTWAPQGEPKQESDGKKLQWSFKMQLTQVDPPEGDQWQIDLALQDNNRYHVALARRPAKGTQFVQLDVIGTQRKNTSFAVADSDNPGPKCIVSGGLGTIQVSYQGKTFHVCCTGCQAAFNDDPERWIAKAAKMKNEIP